MMKEKYVLILVVGQCHSLSPYLIPLSEVDNLNILYNQDYRWIDGESDLGQKLKNEWANYKIETPFSQEEKVIVGIIHVNELPNQFQLSKT
jgi:hypothetical protein